VRALDELTDRADDEGAFGDIADDNRAGADAGTVAHADRAEHLGARADHDVVADGRVAFAGRIDVDVAQRDLVKHQHVRADLDRLADDHAGSVIDEQSGTDASAGMNLDAGEKAGRLRNHARHDGDTGRGQHMRHAMRGERPEAGIREGFEPAEALVAERRIAFEQVAEIVGEPGELAQRLARAFRGQQWSLLQWGRAPEGAERRRMMGSSPCAAKLQWGRAPEGAERMRSLCYIVAFLSASMGPRPGGRGEVSASVARRPGRLLQWGRAPEGAES
jgi:hypothetical protein